MLWVWKLGVEVGKRQGTIVHTGVLGFDWSQAGLRRHAHQTAPFRPPQSPPYRVHPGVRCLDRSRARTLDGMRPRRPAASRVAGCSGRLAHRQPLNESVSGTSGRPFQDMSSSMPAASSQSSAVCAAARQRLLAAQPPTGPSGMPSAPRAPPPRPSNLRSIRDINMARPRRDSTAFFCIFNQGSPEWFAGFATPATWVHYLFGDDT